MRPWSHFTITPITRKRLEELGFVKDVDWVEYEIALSDISMEKIKKTAEIVSAKYNLKLFTGTKKGPSHTCSADFRSCRRILPPPLQHSSF